MALRWIALATAIWLTLATEGRAIDIQTANVADVRAEVEALSKIPPFDRASASTALSEAIEARLADPKLTPLDKASLQISLSIVRAQMKYTRQQEDDLARLVARAVVAQGQDWSKQGRAHATKSALGATDRTASLGAVAAHKAVMADRALLVATKERAPQEFARAQLVIAQVAYDGAYDGDDGVSLAVGDAAVSQALTVFTKTSAPKRYADAICLQQQARLQAEENVEQDASDGMFRFSPKRLALLGECFADAESDMALDVPRAMRVITPFMLQFASDYKASDEVGLSGLLEMFSAANLFDMVTTMRAIRLGGAASIRSLQLSEADTRSALLLRARLDGLRIASQSDSEAYQLTRAEYVELVAKSPVVGPKRGVRETSSPTIAIVAFDKDRAVFGSRNRRNETRFSATAGSWPRDLLQYLMQVGGAVDGGGSGPALEESLRLTASHAADAWLPEYRKAVDSGTEEKQRLLMAAIDSYRRDFEAKWAPALFSAAQQSGVRPGERLTLVLDGASAMLPTLLLRDPKSGKTLLEEYVVVQALSLPIQAEAERRAAVASGKSIGIVAPSTLGLSVEAEGAMAAHALGAASLPTSARSKAQIFSELARTNFWHFATHGFFLADDPLGSGLAIDGEWERIVAKEARTPADQKLLTEKQLTLAELFGAEEALATPRLVVLSACETGLFDIDKNPDEYVGLPAAFLGLGAAGVIASLWEVDDLATSMLMGKMYMLIGQGEHPASALRASQIWLKGADKTALAAFVDERLRSGALTAAQAFDFQARVDAQSATKPFEHPYFWGAFLYYGA